MWWAVAPDARKRPRSSASCAVSNCLCVALDALSPSGGSASCAVSDCLCVLQTPGGRQMAMPAVLCLAREVLATAHRLLATFRFGVDAAMMANNQRSTLLRSILHLTDHPMGRNPNTLVHILGAFHPRSGVPIRHVSRKLWSSPDFESIGARM